MSPGPDGAKPDDGDDATSSTCDDCLSQLSYGEGGGGHPLPLPVLKYARLAGPIPRSSGGTGPASTVVTASALGRAAVRPPGDAAAAAVDAGGDGVEWSPRGRDQADVVCGSVRHVLALGFGDGTVRLVDPEGGGSVLFGATRDEGGAWRVDPAAGRRRGDGDGDAVAELSFDSSSSWLLAVDRSGRAAVFGPLVWGGQSRMYPAGDGRVGFLGSLGASARDDEPAEGDQSLRPPFALVRPPSSTARFTYGESQASLGSLLGGGSADATPAIRPTCAVLDPSYGRRKERAVAVGFDDGRLVLSRLQIAGGGGVTAGITSLFGGGASSSSGGSVSAKKADSVLYQGTSGADGEGILALTWRGGLLAWADPTGVRLFDVESMSRIAHVDRPAGANGNLYPTVSGLRPSLLFEGCDSLLVGWGDCLMSLGIRDAGPAGEPARDASGNRSKKKKRVECTMAWMLDCVSCGVVPMDRRHVAVLGVVPPSEDAAHDGSEGGGEEKAELENVVELQVINREDGRSVSNDRLPLLRGDDPVRRSASGIEVTDAYSHRLLSTYATARMDDESEWDALDDAERRMAEAELGVSSRRGEVSKLTEPHKRWDLSKDVCSSGQEILEDAINLDGQEGQSDDDSACSDNYVFVLCEPVGDMLEGCTDGGGGTQSCPPPPPPVMTVLSGRDAVSVRTRDADDVVSYARSLGKPALALRAAVARRGEIRRHDLDDLVDDFLMALLRLDDQCEGGDEDAAPRALSLSRLKIAVESLPVLLGADASMWQRWIMALGRVPGGLFTARDKIPVRDPELPAYVFEMALETMLGEVDDARREAAAGEGGPGDNKGDDGDSVAATMDDIFLETLRGWGAMSALRRRLQLHRLGAQNRRWGDGGIPPTAADFVKRAERDLNRRITQTAFGVLGDSSSGGVSSTASAARFRQSPLESRDSLFDVEQLTSRLTARISGEDAALDSDRIVLGLSPAGVDRTASRVTIEAVAELELMRERQDRALGYYLALGSLLCGRGSLEEIEREAVESVNGHDPETSPDGDHDYIAPRTATGRSEGHGYRHVLALIELHRLLPLLLWRNYSFDVDDGAAQQPLVSLVALVGIDAAGRFLADNVCPTPSSSSDDATGLPIESVASQLRSRPRLLYWFLFRVFVDRPEMYVRFPTTAVPPLWVQELHREQFSLFLDYSGGGGREGDGVSSTADERDTPFISFLRVS